MKKITRIFTVMAVVSVAAFTQAKAQVDIGVNLQLNRPAAYERNERERPGRPSPRHVWVNEEWTWNGQANKYIYHPGYWMVPPRDGDVWVPGHWKRRGYQPGYKWVPGHWKW
ncbi:MAG TPA: hypothetical protein VNX40_04620 [Mucilaginibacter sp.]|jgi:hypothetical protein|nr:hypothetical protein [Mucilaginibacter sp.]